MLRGVFARRSGCSTSPSPTRSDSTVATWRRTRRPLVESVLTEEDWASITHADVDPLLTRIFALIQPIIIRARTSPLETMGFDRRYAIDLGQHPYAISQTLHYAAGVLGMQPPLVFQNPNDPGGLGFVHAHEPSIMLGRAAFDPNFPMQPMAFVAGRHLTYYRPGFYVRHLVPTGTGLKAWLFAAIKLSAPQFPIAPELEGQVHEATAAMNTAFQGVERELLASQGVQGNCCRPGRRSTSRSGSLPST